MPVYPHTDLTKDLASVLSSHHIVRIISHSKFLPHAIYHTHFPTTVCCLSNIFCFLNLCLPCLLWKLSLSLNKYPTVWCWLLGLYNYLLINMFLWEIKWLHGELVYFCIWNIDHIICSEHIFLNVSLEIDIATAIWCLSLLEQHYQVTSLKI